MAAKLKKEPMNNNLKNLEGMLKDKKFDAIKHRHQDTSTLLSNMTNIDLRLFTGYLIAQFFIVSLILRFYLIFGIIERFGLLVIDCALSLVIMGLLERSKNRRHEAVATIKNCNDALGYTTENIYPIKGIINGKTYYKPWYGKFGYRFGIFIGILGVFLIMFIPFLIELINSGSIPLYLNR